MVIVADSNADIVQAGWSGIVQIILAIVSGYFALRMAQIKEGREVANTSDVVDQTGANEVKAAPRDRPRTGLLKHGIVIVVLICVVGVAGLGAKAIATAKEASELKAKSGAAAVQLNRIAVKAEKHVDEDNWLQHRIWIEADSEVLSTIDHVKYVFDDPEWPPYPTPIDGDSRERNFEINFTTRTAILDYITVIVMYKGYTENGRMQAFAFRWREHVSK